MGSLKEVKSRKIQTSSQSRAWTFMGVDNREKTGTQYEKNEQDNEAFGFPPALRVITILLHEIRANDTGKITEETSHSGKKTSRSSAKPAEVTA